MNKKTLSTVLGLLAMSTNVTVHADCAQLETALKAAPSQMASLKQGLYHKDDPETFNTSWRWDAATADDCMVGQWVRHHLHHARHWDGQRRVQREVHRGHR